MALLNSFWSRHKRLFFIIGLFLAPFLPLLLLRVELPRLHLYDRVQAWFVHPTAEAVGNASGGLGVLWSRYVALVGAERENEGLKKEVGELRQKILEFEELGRENERLHRVVGMPDLSARQGVAAKIIGQDAGLESLSFVINVGSAEGVALRMPVVHTNGIVGTISKVYGHSSVFVSFLDPNHDVDGIVSRSRSRLVVEGKGRHLLARLKYLDRSEDIRVGDLILTGGMDGVFPKGLPIGNIVKIDKLEAGVTQEATLRAAVDPGHLEEVIVLRKIPAPETDEPTAPVPSPSPTTVSQGPRQ